jgi:hypothetical protein
MNGLKGSATSSPKANQSAKSALSPVSRISRKFYRWLDENGDFRDQYARAREEQADKLFREIIEIADDKSGDCITTSDGKPIVDHENIQRSRLRVDARKWAAAKLAPKKYGDRVENDVKGGVHFQPQILIQCSSDKLDEPQVKIATHHEPSELQ